MFIWNGQIQRCQLPEDHEEYHEVEFDGRLWYHESGKIIVMNERE